MKSKKLHFVFTLGILGAVYTSNGQAASQLNLNKGQKFHIDNTAKTLTTMELMGQSMEITSDATLVREVEVKDKAASSYRISSTITKMKTTGSAMGQEMAYDSEKKEDGESEIGKVMSKQINVPKEGDLDFTGRVTNVTKDEEGGSNPMSAMMGGMGGGASAMGTSDVFQLVPGDKKAGDSWSDSTAIDGVKTVTTYTIKEMKGNEATISFTGTQATNKTVENQGTEVNVTMDAKVTGETIVDITTGIVKQKTTTIDGTGSADAMGQAIPMTTKITTTSTVKSM